jgi:death-on-curing family protein
VKPVWLTQSQLVRINQRLVEKTGEPHGLLDADRLATAMASPMHHWQEADIGHLAGALLLGIGRVHPFAAGNRRTALAAAVIFLGFNGYFFAAPDGEPLGQFVERAITGSISEMTFLQAMRDSTVTIEEWEAFQNSRRDDPAASPEPQN